MVFGLFGGRWAVSISRSLLLSSNVLDIIPMLQSSRVSLTFLALWQVLDILIHVATNQVELTRIAASALILAGALAAMKATRPTLLLLCGGVLYLGLNLVFLAERGFTNTATGALRLPLFGFVIISLTALAWFHRTLKASNSQHVLPIKRDFAP